MMKWLFSGLILCSILFGTLNGRMSEVSNAALTECGNAVQLCITLTGAMCMWSGLMKVAQKSGLTEKIAKALGPVIPMLFRGLKYTDPAAQAITLNMSANLLGLGNAATPLGINAMRELDKLNNGSKTASDNMIVFVVLNTASLQLVPTTTALLRANAGSRTPLDILPAVICASACSIAAGLVMAKLLNRLYSPERSKSARRRIPAPGSRLPAGGRQ